MQWNKFGQNFAFPVVTLKILKNIHDMSLYSLNDNVLTLEIPRLTTDVGDSGQLILLEKIPLIGLANVDNNIAALQYIEPGFLECAIAPF